MSQFNLSPLVMAKKGSEYEFENSNISTANVVLCGFSILFLNKFIIPVS